MDELLELKGSIAEMPFNPEIQKIDSVDYNQLPLYRAISTGYQLNKLDLKAKRASRLPSIVAFASFSRNAPTSTFGDYFDGNDNTAVFFPASIIGLKASMPIFGGFSKYQAERQAKLSMQKTYNDLENTKNALNFQARTAQTVYNNSVRSLENQKSNMELATEVLRVARIKYQEGVGSNLEVVTAETSLKEAQTNYIGALYDALVAKIDFLKSKGEL
jgi:outer membrane protein